MIGEEKVMVICPMVIFTPHKLILLELEHSSNENKYPEN